MWSKQNGVANMLGKFICCVAILLASNQQAAAYSNLAKDNIFADVLLTELLNRMDKDIDPVGNYFDMDADLPKNVDLVSRSSKNIPEDFPYRAMFAAPPPPNPSIRDQEYLQHSSLWGHQYVSGGMGEMPNRFPTIKTDASLPAYCNPPNPCPFGYEDSQGCISDFENTAIFSREFQAAQECTCDSEHMFDCAGQDSSAANTNEMTSTMEKFIMHQFQNENDLDNSNAVVKKFYGFAANHGSNNPFLEGEKLPIAAKKGDHIQI